VWIERKDKEERKGFMVGRALSYFVTTWSNSIHFSYTEWPN